MIFEGKSVVEISLQEISKLVENKTKERQHVEYKLIIDPKDNSSKIEFLRDIVSFANAEGGYIIVGIRDDGNGVPQRIEHLDRKTAESLKKTLSSLCQDGIAERIYGLEIITVFEDESKQIILISIPKSGQGPHMVSYQNHTDFYLRHSDGKREMSIGEVRNAFQNDSTGQRLSSIESMLRNASPINPDRISRHRTLATGSVDAAGQGSMEEPDKFSFTDGLDLSEISKLYFLGRTTFPCFYISITPEYPKIGSVDIDSSAVRSLLENPPESRRHGWNLKFPADLERTKNGIIKGRPEYSHLELTTNGHMEFWKVIDDHYCWRQDEEEMKTKPRFWPYPVNEYPVSFLRLYRALVDKIGLPGKYLLTICFNRVKNSTLLPGAPSDPWTLLYDRNPSPLKQDKIEIPNVSVPHDFNPDLEWFKLSKMVYAHYKLGQESIPFWDDNTKRFDFTKYDPKG